MTGRFAMGIAQRWTVFAVCVVLWQLATAAANDPYFPTPVEIVATMHEKWFSGPVSHVFLTQDAIDDILPSLGRLLAGWAIGGAIGIVAGLALGRSRTGLDYAGPLINFLRALPAVALLPVFLVLFKLGTPVQLATIVFGVVWPVLLNTIQGAQSVDEVQVETARAFGIPRMRRLFGIMLPSALPKIFSGLRIALSLSLVLMVISELVGATNGIGRGLQEASHAFDLPATWALIALLGILGNLLNWLFLVVERRALSWQHARSAQDA